MLLKALNVVNSRGSELGLPLDDASGGFVVKEIQGLGPAKATMVASRFANLDGAQYHSSRVEPRNIVVKLGLTPDYAAYSVYDLRDQLYNFFMPKTSTTLKFRLFDRFSDSILTQNKYVEINGRIESFEPEIFTDEPTVDLSIMCYDPDFLNPESTVFEDMTVDSLVETTLTYAGSVDTGVIFKLLPDRTVEEFTIYHNLSGGSLNVLYFIDQLLAGDELSIGSIPGSKYVIRKRDGVETTLLYGLTSQSAWLTLSPGDNIFRVHTAGDPIPYTIEYADRYGGL